MFRAAIPPQARQKTLLSLVDILVDSRHYAPRDGRRENPVIRVGNAKKAGVRDKACVLFGKDIKKAVIKALGGTVTLSDNLKNSVKEKGSKVGSLALHAAKGIPSGPGAESVGRLTISVKKGKSGGTHSFWSTLTSYPLKKETR